MLQDEFYDARTGERRLDDEGINLCFDHCPERFIEIAHTANQVDLDSNTKGLGGFLDVVEEWPREWVRRVCKCRDAACGRQQLSDQL